MQLPSFEARQGCQMCGNYVYVLTLWPPLGCMRLSFTNVCELVGTSEALHSPVLEAIVLVLLGVFDAGGHLVKWG